MDGVVSVFPIEKHKLHTTMSWDFMGLKEGKRSNRNPTTESDTIIGVIDSGIWPESKSFGDKGYSPPPLKWKGACEGGRNFTCNNKLIGARYYTTESARDDVGHGSHTASTAAGNAVSAVSFYGLGNGTARGGVPGERVAAYKACNFQGCRSDTILSAFDDAIADQVDLITISIGVIGLPFEKNPIAIGAFHAMAKGILTVNAAGNDGPRPSTVSSLAPWIFTVAASNTNRAFVTKVVLGNGKTVDGRSVNSFDHNGTMYPLVYGGSASTKCVDVLARLCTPGCLDRKLVKAKIVLRDSEDNTEEVRSKGAVGSIVTTFTFTDVSYMFSLPVSVLLSEDFKTVLAYMNATKRPKAAVLKSQTIFTQTAPVVAGFSSRGPNILLPDILKPDITAPGVEILAAYSQAPLTDSQSDRRRVKYSVDSGTSMSFPHVAGASAYIKTFHPEWSPSMIQSAIMTTAWPMSMDQGEFAYGSGHLDPIKGVDPGLVYDVDKSDHINFLCGMNYTLKMLQLISGDAVTCTGKKLPKNLNYPSMTARVAPGKPFQVNFSRTVRNVGMRSTYKAAVLGSRFEVRVFPEALSLNTMHEKKSFELTVSGNGPEDGKMVSSQLIWSDGVHITLRSPFIYLTVSQIDCLSTLPLAVVVSVTPSTSRGIHWPRVSDTAKDIVSKMLGPDLQELKHGLYKLGQSQHARYFDIDKVTKPPNMRIKKSKLVTANAS
ncbi:hypothetical protein Bca101_083919 [Brassica carinata]